MKKTHQNFVLLLCLLTFTTRLHAQSSDSTLDVVNWNMEWFGSSVYGPDNKDLQEDNAKKIMRYLNADVYALCEVVDTVRFKRVVDYLGSDYAYIISDYCSLAATTLDADWLTGQKLAFIYKKSVLSNVSARGFLRNSGAAYYNFASGRLPFILNANVDINGIKRNMNFFLIHAKAGSTANDFNRRKAGAGELKDSLDEAFATATNIILGDFNDDFDNTISSGSGTLSSYDALIKDSTDADHYIAVTLPLSYQGVNSTLDYPDIIDHVVISNEADSMYVKGSATVRKDILAVVPGYEDHNTSDHYPVFTSYKMIVGDTIPVAVKPPPVVVNNPFKGFKVGPNPFGSELIATSGMALHNLHLVLYNVMGQKVWAGQQADISAQSTFDIAFPNLAQGTYFLTVISKEFTHSFHLYKY